MSWNATSSNGPAWPNPASGTLCRLVLVGPPGAGKSSQAARLASYLRVAHVSTGDLLREEVRRESPLGIRARDYMSAGRLVPDSLILHLVEHHLGSALETGFVLDGYPRTLHQAQRFMRSLGLSTLDRVIELATPDDVAVRRLIARAVCDQCGQIEINAVGGRCIRCGGNVTRRGDDEEGVIRSRLATYRSQTRPMLNLFRNARLLTLIDGNRPPHAVTADLLRLVTTARNRAERGLDASTIGSESSPAARSANSVARPDQ